MFRGINGLIIQASKVYEESMVLDHLAVNEESMVVEDVMPMNRSI